VEGTKSRLAKRSMKGRFSGEVVSRRQEGRGELRSNVEKHRKSSLGSGSRIFGGKGFGEARGYAEEKWLIGGQWKTSGICHQD